MQHSFPSLAFSLDATLSGMINDADSQCASLLKATRTEHSVLVQAVSMAEKELDDLQKSLKSLRSLGKGLSNFGVQVASKVQDANAQKEQALRADSVLEHLLTFADAGDLGLFDTRAELFENESRVEEAAGILSELSLALSKARGETRQGFGTSQEQNGSLNTIFEQVELYKGIFANRLVTRFDAAVVGKDVDEMSVCVKAMGALDPENFATLMERYLSSAPLFKDASQASRLVEEAKKLSFNRDTMSLNAADQKAIAILQILTDLYSVLSEGFRAEAVMMEQIFSDSTNFIALLVHRTFEVFVQPALSEALRVPSDDAPREALHAHLQLLTEAYRKTLAFAEELAMLAGPQSGLNAEELVNNVCSDALKEYESIEMSWMASISNEKLARANVNQASTRETLLDLLAVNEEAVKRCVIVTPQSELPAVVSLFFTKSVRPVKSAPQSTYNWSLYPPAEQEDSQINVKLSLLDHVESLLVNGMDLCTRTNLPKLSRNNLHAVNQEVESPLSLIMQSASQAVELVILLKAHFDRVIVPHVSSSTTELARCTDGISSLTQRLEMMVANAFERVIDRLAKNMASILSTQQLRHDFNPLKSSGSEHRVDRSNVTVTFDEPTPACESVVAVLRATMEAVSRHLHGSNKSSFLDALALVTVNIVETHSSKQTFSVEGGLRWRRDLDEYCQVFNKFGVRAAETAFEDLRVLASLLIIGPEGLPGLIETVVRQVGVVRVQNVLERREDWKYAKVSGRPLASLLAP